MKSLYMKDYKWFLPQNQGEKTFLVIDGTSYWLSISDHSLKDMKVKGCQCPDY